jgi:hypothetical protein
VHFQRELLALHRAAWGAIGSSVSLLEDVHREANRIACRGGLVRPSAAEHRGCSIDARVGHGIILPVGDLRSRFEVHNTAILPCDWSKLNLNDIRLIEPKEKGAKKKAVKTDFHLNPNLNLR